MRRLILLGTVVFSVLIVREAGAQLPIGSSRPISSNDAPPLGTPQRVPPNVTSPGDGAGDRPGNRRGRRGRHRRADWWFDLGFPWWLDDPDCPIYLPPYRYFGYTVVAPLTPPVGYNAPAPVAQPVPQPGPAAPAPAPKPEPAKPKPSHAKQKARAGKFIGFGDANFRKAKYNSAVERYKTAITIAPDMPETYFRQGFVYVAMGYYEKAAAAFRRGLRLRADWSGSPFRLDQIYGPAALAKTAHIESLAGAVDANPFDADLLFVLGIQLFFDGQRDRSQLFFERAAQLGGNEDGLLDAFLPRPKPGGAPNPKPQPGGKLVF